MKKIVFIFSITIMSICIFSLNTYSYDTVELEQEYNISDYVAKYNDFGEISKISEVKTTSLMEVNKSSNEKENIELLDKVYQLYSCQKYIDIPVKVYDAFYIEPNTKFNIKYAMSHMYTVSSFESDYSSRCLFSDYTKSKEIEVEETKSVFNLTNNFKVEKNIEMLVNVSKDEITKYEFGSNTIESYNNSSNEPLIVKKCFRQKYMLVIGCVYQANYSSMTTSSGWMFKKYTTNYSLKGIDCISMNTYLVPVGQPYYHISYYNESGEFVSQGHDSIIFI